jgi:hypothetical protein
VRIHVEEKMQILYGRYYAPLMRIRNNYYFFETVIGTVRILSTKL